MFAYCNETGGCITNLCNAIGYGNLQEAIKDTKRIIAMYGGCSENGVIYTAMQERGNKRLINKL